MRIKPRNDRVLVKRDVSESRSRGGIIIPDSAQNQAYIGTVLAVGPGRFTEHGVQLKIVDLEPGDRVIFGKYAGSASTDALSDEARLVMLREDEIMAHLIESDPKTS